MTKTLKNVTYIAALLAAVVVPIQAGETRAASVSPTVGIINTGDRSVARFDSLTERLSVKPIDWQKASGTPSAAALTARPSPSGPPGQVESGFPDPNADLAAQQSFPEAWEGIDSAADPAVTAGNVPFGTVDLFDQYAENAGAVNTNFPQRAIGKLLMTQGSCSASVVSPNNVIVTAAHCCYDRTAKKWNSGFVFVPAYRNGAGPYGTFPWQQATILSSWITNGDIPSDVCVIKLGNNGLNKPVTYYTGWLGRAWNFGPTQVMHAVGYPGNIGGAALMELCVAESFGSSAACGGNAILNMGCSMTYGSSGGPWVMGYRSGDWVNSVVHGYISTNCTGTLGQTFDGASFTSTNIVTLCTAIGC